MFLMKKAILSLLLCSSGALLAYPIPENVETILEKIMMVESDEVTFKNTVGAFSCLMLDIQKEYPLHALAFYQEILTMEPLLEVVALAASYLGDDYSLSNQERRITDLVFEVSVPEFIQKVLTLPDPRE